jgi:hypothetical protein
MPLSDRLDEMTTLFTDPDLFGETVTFYPGGSTAYATNETVDVLWDEDSLPGTNEVHGDGVTIERNAGRRIRQSITIEAPASLVVDETNDPPDKFVRADGTVAIVKRKMGADAAMKSYRCIAVNDLQIKSAHRSG